VGKEKKQAEGGEKRGGGHFSETLKKTGVASHEERKGECLAKIETENLHEREGGDLRKSVAGFENRGL